MGIYQAARNDRCPSKNSVRIRGRVPYGYRIERSDLGQELRIVPDRQAAQVVRRIFCEYAAGRGLSRIAEDLAADNVLSPSEWAGTAPPGTARWSRGAVRSILVNERYGGIINGQLCDAITPIVPPDILERVRSVFAARDPVPETAHQYPLRGLLRCADCMRSMQGSWNNSERYYRCRRVSSDRATRSGEHPRNIYLRERLLLDALHSWLREACADARFVSGPELAPHRVFPPLEEATPDQLTVIYAEFQLRLRYSNVDKLLEVKTAFGSGNINMGKDIGRARWSAGH